MADKKEEKKDDLLSIGARVSLLFIFGMLLVGIAPTLGMITTTVFSGNEIGAFEGKSK